MLTQVLKEQDIHTNNESFESSEEPIKKKDFPNLKQIQKNTNIVRAS